MQKGFKKRNCAPFPLSDQPAITEATMEGTSRMKCAYMAALYILTARNIAISPTTPDRGGPFPSSWCNRLFATMTQASTLVDVA